MSIVGRTSYAMDQLGGSELLDSGLCETGGMGKCFSSRG